METISVESLRADTVFTGDLLIDTSFVLLPHATPLSENLIKALRAWGYEHVLCDGAVSLGGEIDDAEDELNKEVENKVKIGENVKKAIESSRTTKLGNSEQARLQMVRGVYEEYMNYIEKVFTYYTTHKKIDKDELSETVQDLVSFIRDHRRYMLRINPSTETCSKNFLVIHSMRTTVLALAIAMQMHMPLSKMIELGVTCILHEIGMLRLPPQLYMTDKKLSPAEKAQITKHTVYGYEIIKDLSFSPQITLGILDHHERENGSGYPRRLSADKISSNAKIIALACTYEAISSSRSYKDERSTFDAIVELIQNKDNLYNENVIKALLYTVSFYPIGSYVYLSNRKVALVIDVNPDNPKCPVVQLPTEKEKDGSFKVINTGENGIVVSRILSKSEKNDILKFFAQKEQEELEADENTEELFDEPPASETKPAAVEDLQKPAPIEPVKPATVVPPKKPVTPTAAPKKAPEENSKPSISGEIEDVDINFFN